MSKKITKRERKLLNGPNYAVSHSLNKGIKQEGGYIGDTPKFANVTDPETGIESVKQVAKGLPFVRPSNFGIR